MDWRCPPQFNKSYVTSVEGILKTVLILVGAFCWGLVYIGDVMKNSNMVPEINDQVLFCAALTLPSWLLTLISFLLFSFAKAAAILFVIDAGLSIVFGVLYIGCVGYCSTYKWFIWWCEDSYEVVDTGECFDPLLRNAGQNLAVMILGSVLALGYCVSGIVTIIRGRERRNRYHAARSTAHFPTDDDL